MIAESKRHGGGRPSGAATRQHVGRGERAGADEGLDLALLGQAGQPAGQPVDDAVFPAAQRVEVDGGGGEGEPGVAHLLGFGDDFGGVQQGFGGDAADVEAHPAQRAAGVDHDDLAAEVGGPERGGVAAGTGAQHQHLGVHVALLRRCRARVRRPGPSRSVRRWAAPPTTRSPQARSAPPAALPPSPASRRRGGRGLAGQPLLRRRASRGPASTSTVPITVPSETVSPTATASDTTVPATGDGTSRVALSAPG